MNTQVVYTPRFRILHSGNICAYGMSGEAHLGGLGVVNVSMRKPVTPKCKKGFKCVPHKAFSKTLQLCYYLAIMVDMTTPNTPANALVPSSQRLFQ